MWRGLSAGRIKPLAQQVGPHYQELDQRARFSNGAGGERGTGGTSAYRDAWRQQLPIAPPMRVLQMKISQGSRKSPTSIGLFAGMTADEYEERTHKV